ncbi:MAG: class I SAM-dependent methyltransferase [Gammaproteobacteria bacterium]|nr:class I SAM-dependent methyltransferase [Gammaproteobacteria bacterium]
MIRPIYDLQRTARYANWLFNPLQRPLAPSIYELLGRDGPTSRGLYLNLGYWRDATTLDDACEALVRLVGDAARFRAGDRLVDCGFGFAEQDIYWARRSPTLGIIGLNVTPSQVVHARQRVRQAGLDGRIDLRVGSATAMPLADASADVVIALESAFHFRTRERFFREALRVLRPGGRLVTADILPIGVANADTGGYRWSRAWRWSASRFAIPDDNAYARGDYRALLARIGFAAVDVRSIRDDVYVPLVACLRRDPTPLQALHPLPRALARASLSLDAGRLFRGLDYVVATAEKR